MKKWVWASVVVVLVLGWALHPVVRWKMHSETQIALEQLLGRGCIVQEAVTGASLNPLAEWTVRHPELQCPMWAASRLSMLRPENVTERDAILRGFEMALSGRNLPEKFDTGDGVILYGETIREARRVFVERNGGPLMLRSPLATEVGHPRMAPLALWRARRHDPVKTGKTQTGFQNKDLGIHGAGANPWDWGKRRRA